MWKNEALPPLQNHIEVEYGWFWNAKFFISCVHLEALDFMLCKHICVIIMQILWSTVIWPPINLYYPHRSTFVNGICTKLSVEDEEMLLVFFFFFTWTHWTFLKYAKPGQFFYCSFKVTQRSFQLNDSLLFTPLILGVICFVVTVIWQTSPAINLN